MKREERDEPEDIKRDPKKLNMKEERVRGSQKKWRNTWGSRFSMGKGPREPEETSRDLEESNVKEE